MHVQVIKGTKYIPEILKQRYELKTHLLILKRFSYINSSIEHMIIWNLVSYKFQGNDTTHKTEAANIEPMSYSTSTINDWKMNSPLGFKYTSVHSLDLEIFLILLNC